MKKAAIGFYVGVTLALMAWGFYQAIYVAPNDAMQGEIFRIIYYHVPSWAVAFIFLAVSLAGSIGFLAFRRNFPNRAQVADAWAVAGAEVGVVFLTVGLTTGPLWGRRAWGIWWTWDARLTTSLVLWLIYVSYLLLRRFAAGPQMQTLAAVLGCADCVHVEPLVADAASGSGVWGFVGLGHGQDDGGRADVEYAGLAVLGIADPGAALPGRAKEPVD